MYFDEGLSMMVKGKAFHCSREVTLLVLGSVSRRQDK